MNAAAFRRLLARSALLLWAMAAYVFRARQKPKDPARILVVSRFLLGDTLMLAPLIAALRHHHPAAQIVLAVQSALLPLFAARPYGVTALAFDLDNLSSLRRLRRGGPYDLAVVPGDNRNAIAARAFRARWIVAHDGDRPQWKNRICDELVALSPVPGTIYDALADLAGPPCDLAYHPGDWTLPAPVGEVAANTPQRHVILHVGSSSPGRRWSTELWRELADELAARGHAVFWSAGPGEEAIAREIDPTRRYQDTSGRFDLPQLWHFVANAALLVSADTGIVHMAKLNGCPTVCLYGPGGEALVGRGRFFRHARIRGVIVAHFRDRRDGRVFKRRMPWAQDWPGPAADERWPDPGQQLQAVLAAALELLATTSPPTT